MPEQGERSLRRRLLLVGFVAVCAAVVIVGKGIFAREESGAQLREWTDAQATPTVAVAAPKAGAVDAELPVPGRLEAYYRAPIFARVSGYVKDWKVDIGARVKANQLLAEIDAPDLDQQLMQARAALNVAQANSKLSEITAKRWQSLAGTDAVATQDVDQRTFTWDANIAQVNAAKANVDRLVAEEGFKRLIAPFDGIVTARETDIGQLINVGATGGAELFVVSETQKLRIYVNVPQNYVPNVPAGTQATIQVPEHPGKTYKGTVEYSAQAVNPNTGTTLMQIIVDNSAGEMMPGDYASIRLQAAPAARVLSVPSSAIIFDAKGVSIATVDNNNHVLLKAVTIGRDLGQVVEIAAGLSPNDRVIQNPPDGIANSDLVGVVGSAASAVAAAPPKPKSNHG